MDLNLPSAGEALRGEALEWLESWIAANPSDQADPRTDLELRRRFQRDAYDAGWLLPAAPTGRGGRAVDPETELWIKLDFARRGAPKLPNVQGPGVVAQALLGFGTPEQQEFVEAVSRGDVWWCLGMSEPEAGSDLASLRTRARQGADGNFTIDGQKVWTSHARESEHCLLFARTGEPDSGHRGITAFVVPMSTPGITVRKIEKIGVEDEEFCEVFFDGVVVPESAMLGPLNGGWKVAMTSLSHERDMVWIMNLVEIEEALRTVRAELGRAPRPALELELGALEADADSIWLSGLRGLAARLAGKPDHETTLLKLFSTEAAQRAFLLAARSCGPDAAILAGSPRRSAGIAAGEIEALGATIYGGTSEVQRNIIGERVLGLPR
jgi:alkylation response protein AidB-like acyl-CoA dehydrogenase